MTVTAMYPGTFDPITLGHIDIVKRAANIFDKLIIAIAVSAKKKPLFTLEQRIKLTRAALADIGNIEVYGFDGLAVDFARQNNIRVILRGLRTVADMEYEAQLASMNRMMAPDIETLFLLPAEKYAFVSSSVVREIGIMGGNISAFVPPVVVAAFREIAANKACE